jgi:hypothetical protein
VPVGVGEATGTVDEPVGVDEADEVAEVDPGVAVVLGVGLVEVVAGEVDGEDAEVAVTDGEVEGVDGVAGVAGVVGLPWAGVTRFGVCTC